MRTILFCQNPYAFGIMEPIMEVLKEKDYPFLWFVQKNIAHKFPFKNEACTSDISDLAGFNSDAIFVPGNEVPYYLRGLKVQIFHGLAGEKKGHFRIRHYFDLYLTQGPYFTRGFNKLKQKHKNFDVIETGWPKLDIYGKERNKYEVDKSNRLKSSNTEKILLYAPTFSPRLTSAPFLIEQFENLAANKKYLIVIKFHDLMAQDHIDAYKNLADRFQNVIYEEERNIIKHLLMADIMISDTSSVVYEFLLLDKPVVTFKNSSSAIKWQNSQQYENLDELIHTNLTDDPFAEKRAQIMADYHPYTDGRSSDRMIASVESFIAKNGVPEKRKLSFLRRRKINKIFGKYGG